jgi:predicted SprT family Zn-dependent metalloprotease
MNLQHAENLALELMKLHGVIDMGYTFAFKNSRRAAGTCNYTKKKITLSQHLTALADEVDIRDTILHEIAHALCPNHGHDGVWQRKAIEIGCNGKRCYNEKESLSIAYQMVAKYKAVCKNGHEHFLNRAPKRNRSCGYCSRRFDINNLLTYNRV